MSLWSVSLVDRFLWSGSLEVLSLSPEKLVLFSWCFGILGWESGSLSLAEQLDFVVLADWSGSLVLDRPCFLVLRESLGRSGPEPARG